MDTVSDATATLCSFLMTDKEHTTYLGLGTNLGDKQTNITVAIRKIEERIGRVERQSALFFSQPWGFVSENSFVNAVVLCKTMLSPRQLLRATQSIEKEMGRKGKSVQGVYHDRIIDIDILLYDDLHINYPDLVIPHPLMQKRDFVMIPLREVMAQVGDEDANEVKIDLIGEDTQETGDGAFPVESST